MKIKFLGTKSTFANELHSSSFIVDIDNFRLLVDCGHTTLKALNKHNIRVDSIDGVVVTNLCPDRTANLGDIALILKNSYKKKAKLFCPIKLRGPLWGGILKEYLSDENNKALKDFFNFGNVIHNFFSIGSQRFKFVPVSHIGDRIHYGILAMGRFYYSGNSLLNLEYLFHFSHCVPHIIQDWQLTNFTGKKQVLLSDINKLSPNIREKIIITNYDENIDDQEVDIAFAGIKIAREGMEIEISS